MQTQVKFSSSVLFPQCFQLFQINFKICFWHLVLLEIRLRAASSFLENCGEKRKTSVGAWQWPWPWLPTPMLPALTLAVTLTVTLALLLVLRPSTRRIFQEKRDCSQSSQKWFLLRRYLKQLHRSLQHDLYNFGSKLLSAFYSYF